MSVSGDRSVGLDVPGGVPRPARAPGGPVGDDVVGEVDDLGAGQQEGLQGTVRLVQSIAYALGLAEPAQGSEGGSWRPEDGLVD